MRHLGPPVVLVDEAVLAVVASVVAVVAPVVLTAAVTCTLMSTECVRDPLVPVTRNV